MVVDNIVFCLGTRFGSKTGVWAQAEQFLSSSFFWGEDFNIYSLVKAEKMTITKGQNLD